MKKALFTALLALAFNLGFAAESADLFKVDDQEINTEFAQLNELEQFVNANEGITLEEINPSNPLVQNVNNSSDILGILSTLRGDAPLGIPSFVWGLCLSWVGVLVVYFVADDRDETKKAFTGCAVNAGLYIIWIVVYVVIIGNSFLFFG
ncbi:MAG TPA: hypothetical protein PL185_03500 [Flavobacteriales bacterium]|nr:hypothetical protein [Flavobacteriales bacterium]HPH81608.1 hypothetical protein [Flavobacteriales bacterium]